MKTLSNVKWATLFFVLAVSTNIFAAETDDKKEATVPVTQTHAHIKTLEVWRSSQGKLLSKTAPLIAAEVAGRIVSVKIDVGEVVKKGQILAEIDATDYRLAKELVSADIVRLEALIKAQKLQVKRFQRLVKQRSANQSSLDDAEAQLGSMQAQIVGAQVRLQQADRNILKTRIISPVNGRITERKVSVGDYLNPGTPVFRITTSNILQARLPFPQKVAHELKIGQKVVLSSPIQPDREITARITEISSEISPSNLAIHVFVDLKNPGGWEPGASVKAKVLVDTHKDAVLVAEGSIIRRPAGLVVYKVEQSNAKETLVTTGLRDNGSIEIVSGVAAHDSLALDGAAYLTDGISVDIKATDKGEK